jgi:hypothetical protein
MLNLVISTVVFFLASWYFKRYLDEQNIPKGMTRTMLIFTLAAMLSWGSGALVDWTQIKIEGPRVAAQTSEGLSQLLRDADQMRQ